jgi:predicted lipoprotein with Yx(FWY)xxD motif
MKKAIAMSILTPPSALRSVLFGALIGSAVLGACATDEPGIVQGVAGSSGSGDQSEAGETSAAGSGASSGASAGDGNGAAGHGATGQGEGGQGANAGSTPDGAAGEPVVGSGGTEGGTDDPSEAGAPPDDRGDGGGAGEGGGEPPVAMSCLFHTDAPPADEGAGGDGSTSPTVVVQSNAFIGSYLTDAAGRTLYTYGNDFPGDCNTAPISNCIADCLVSWPPFDAAARGLGAGLDDAAFGTITLGDGSPQTTYFGWPLYYYKSDLTQGQMTGQGKAKTWHAAEPVPPSVVIMKIGTLKYLADAAGHTLYVSAADQPGTVEDVPISNCSNECLDTFEPFHSKTLSMVTSLEPGDFEVFVRSGRGGVQIAYKGLPLYRASTDLKSGQMNGALVAGFTAAVP